MTHNRVGSAYFIFLIFIIILVGGCTHYPEDVDATLKLAGKNSSELKSVLQKYSKNAKDSLKYRAACFLIGNMKWHSGDKVMVPEDMWNLFLIEDSLVRNKIRDRSNWKYEDALNGYKYGAKKLLFKEAYKKVKISEEFELDCSWMDAELLVNIIETAFEVKGNEWCKQLNFDEFCEYVLAYRFNNEPYMDIRKRIQNHYIGMYNTDSFNGSVEKTITALNDYIIHFNWDWDDLISVKDIGFYNLLNWNNPLLVCDNHVATEGSILRAIGMPVTQIFIPKWIDSDLGGHSMCAIYKDKKQLKPFTAIFKDLDEYDSPHSLSRASKLYQKTFAVQYDSPFFIRAKGEQLPAWVNSPCIKDVTDLFLETTDLNIEMAFGDTTGNLCYFAIPIYGKWEPVAWGIIDRVTGTAKFKNLPIGLMGIIGAYDERGFTPCGKLIKVGPDNSHSFIKPIQQKGSFTTLRKFPLKVRLQEYVSEMIGTAIEGSNKSDFSDAKQIGTIKDTLLPYFQDLLLDKPGNYRYYRLTSPTWSLNIAELEFITDQKLAKTSNASPLPIFSSSSINIKKYYKFNGSYLGEETAHLAFDGNILTYCGKKWEGIDLGKPQLINKIRIAPRNANNGIVSGNNYELFYWDENWLSAGKKDAIYNFLTFDQVPLNTIYWLRNLTTGKEEQPFYMINGKQVFINGGLKLLKR